jgi:hypothetical protein
MVSTHRSCTNGSTNIKRTLFLTEQRDESEIMNRDYRNISLYNMLVEDVYVYVYINVYIYLTIIP